MLGMSFVSDFPPRQRRGTPRIRCETLLREIATRRRNETQSLTGGRKGNSQLHVQPWSFLLCLSCLLVSFLVSIVVVGHLYLPSQ